MSYKNKNINYSKNNLSKLNLKKMTKVTATATTPNHKSVTSLIDYANKVGFIYKLTLKVG